MTATTSARPSTPPRPDLRALIRFPGPVSEFWQALTDQARNVSRARQAVLYIRRPDEEGAANSGGSGSWRALARAPHDGSAPDLGALCPAHLFADLARDGLAETQGALLMQVLLGQPGQEAVVLLRGLPPGTDRVALIAALMPICAAPIGHDAERGARRALRDAERMAQTLDLVARLQGSETFDHAALTWVNGLAEQFACDSVTLIWRARSGMRLRAVSHAEGVTRRTQASALAEQAAEEALAQGSEILWPEARQDEATVSHSHGQYAAMTHPGHLITLPLLSADNRGRTVSLGAVLLERRRAPFSATEQWALRLQCDLARAPFERFERESGWMFPRVGRAIAPSIPLLFKPRTAPGRVLLGLAVAAIVGLAFVPVPFRITAPVVLRTDAMAYVSAPFDGFVEASPHILGDVIRAGDPLFELDRSELDLQRNALLAELAQANREAEIRRATNNLSDMQIARARAEEITTELRQIDLRLASAVARAPISGIIVEGEPAKMIGEPVRRGDPLVTVAALSSLYVEAAVAEQDLSFIVRGQNTEVTLLARPDAREPLSVKAVIPAATVQDGGNVFPVRLTPPDAQPDWWLPGMTGVAKISVDRRALGWVASRRLVDYLRLMLWV